MEPDGPPNSNARAMEILQRVRSENEKRNWKPCEPAPADKLWRYMDLGKFLALIQDGRLFFPSVTTLSDRLEGSLSRREAGMRALWDVALRAGEPNLTPKQWGERFRTTQEARASHDLEVKDHVFVSCWYSGQDESAALWDLYGEGSNTVCLETSFSALQEALASHRRYLLYSVVSYVDFHATEDEVRSGASQCARFFRKHRAYSHENEVRVLAHQTAEIGDIPPYDDIADGAGGAGLALPVELKALIQRVIVPPRALDWYPRTVQSFLDAAGLEVRVDRSILDADPYF